MGLGFLSSSGIAELTEPPLERLAIVDGVRLTCVAKAHAKACATATVKALLDVLHAARARGFAMIDKRFTSGMTATATRLLRGRDAVGVISIAGPRQRLTPTCMLQLAPGMLAATAELGPISGASTLFGWPQLGKS